jgi:glycine oxidase
MPAKGVILARTADVIVAGAGVIGTAIAWRAAAAGLDVAVVDPECGEAASLVAAGMLAPASESLFGEEALLALNQRAASGFPAFVAELEQAAGQPVGLRREGTLALAYDASDQAALARLTAFRRSLGLDAEELDGRSCRGLEPFLGPDVRGGCLFRGDWSVDNRRYVAALRQAMRAAGARAVPGRVAAIRVQDGRVAGVRLAADGTAGGINAAEINASEINTGETDTGETDTGEINAGTVVIAAGTASAGIAGLPGPLRGAVRPVKGQLLRLRHPAAMPPVLSHTIRALVRGGDVYLVPRADGEIVVGATSEERGQDRTVTAGAVHDLLDDAMSVLPVVSEMVLAETCAGLRPATPDNGPIVGRTDTGGLLIATGHYRNGILLSGLTADAVLALLTGQPPAQEWAPFSPRRFTGAVVS